MSTQPPNPQGPIPPDAQGPPKPSWLDRMVRRLAPRVELIAAISLSIATLLTSWSGYEAALWDGRQAAAYSQANNIRTTAARYATQAGQHQAEDLFMFSQWLNAYATRSQRLQAFYQDRFRQEFVPAFDAWIASKPRTNPDAPPSPFAMPEYRLEALEQSHQLERLADEKMHAGIEANRIGDSFVEATVVLASVMFFGGICQVFATPKARVALAAVAAVGCVWGILKVVSLPMLLGM